MSIFGTILGKIFGATPAEAAPAARARRRARRRSAAAAPAPDAPASVPADVASQGRYRRGSRRDERKEPRNPRLARLHRRSAEGSRPRFEPAARKQLAAELKYDGDTNNSAKMNIWLHDKVIALVAANGGKVPADLLKK